MESHLCCTYLSLTPAQRPAQTLSKTKQCSLCISPSFAPCMLSQKQQLRVSLFCHVLIDSVAEIMCLIKIYSVYHVFSFYCHRYHSCFVQVQLCLLCSVFHYLLSHSRGIPTVPGTVTLKKDSQNLIGISIGGGAQYCPCLYIVQVGTWGGRANERALA